MVMPPHIFDRRTLPFRVEFSIAGAHCILSTNSHAILSSSRHWCGALEPAGDNSFGVEILEDDSLDSQPVRPPHFRGMKHLVFTMLAPHNFFVFDLLRKKATGIVSSETAHDSAFLNKLVLPIAIGVLGTAIGIAPIHGACLEHNAKGFLITGVSGAGKSTLSVALAQHGFTFLSDEWTYIAKKQNQLVAYGISAPAKLLSDAVRFFPQLQTQEPLRTPNGELAYEINPASLFSSKQKSASRPEYLFFLERDSRPGSDFFPSSREYARAFFEQNAELLPEELPHMKVQRSALIQEVANLPSWILRTGDSPQQTAAAIEQFCERF